VALWLIRAGKYGEHESRFIDDGRIYLTWGGLTGTSLAGAADYDAIKQIVVSTYPNEPPRKVGNWAGQIWAFALGVKPGDWVVLPSKQAATIAIGEVLGPYAFDPGAPPDYRHSHPIKWLNTQVPRSAFDQDLLYSFGAFLTVCEIKRNDAEKRVRAMSLNAWASVPMTVLVPAQGAPADDTAGPQAPVDFEQLAQDAIAHLIIQRFMGHGMARLVDAVLKAQGFATHLSPEGADKGIDILAGSGPFGFERPRICVQVKSGDTPADRPEFTQLIGAMQSVGADQGLFVSWAGFKSTVTKEVPAQFFKVRVWTAKDLIEQLLANYDKLDPDIRADLPLRRIWTIATPDD
jgi:restriction system protein